MEFGLWTTLVRLNDSRPLTRTYSCFALEWDDPYPNISLLKRVEIFHVPASEEKDCGTLRTSHRQRILM